MRFYYLSHFCVGDQIIEEVSQKLTFVWNLFSGIFHFPGYGGGGTVMSGIVCQSLDGNEKQFPGPVYGTRTNGCAWQEPLKGWTTRSAGPTRGARAVKRIFVAGSGEGIEGAGMDSLK